MRRRKIKVNHRKRILLFKKRMKRLFVLLLIFLIAAWCFNYTDKTVRPMVEKISQVKTQQLTSQAISQVIYQEMSTGKFTNDNLLQRERGDGKSKSDVSLVWVNTQNINKLSARIQMSVQKKLNGLGDAQVKVPIGNLLNNDLISNIGPSIAIKMLPIGSVSVNYKTEFVADGINQTKYKVYLEVKAKMQAYISIARVKVDVTDTLPIAETIIVGPTPNSYIEVPDIGQAENLMGT